MPVPPRNECDVLPNYNINQGTAGPFRLQAIDCNLANATGGSCGFLSSINLHTNASGKKPVQDITSGKVTMVNSDAEGVYPGWIRCVNPSENSSLGAHPAFQIKVPTKIGVTPMPEEWKTIRVVSKGVSAHIVWAESDDIPTLPLWMYHDYSDGRKIPGIVVGAHGFTSR